MKAASFKPIPKLLLALFLTAQLLLLRDALCDATGVRAIRISEVSPSQMEVGMQNVRNMLWRLKRDVSRDTRITDENSPEFIVALAEAARRTTGQRGVDAIKAPDGRIMVTDSHHGIMMMALIETEELPKIRDENLRRETAEKLTTNVKVILDGTGMGWEQFAEMTMRQLGKGLISEEVRMEIEKNLGRTLDRDPSRWNWSDQIIRQAAARILRDVIPDSFMPTAIRPLVDSNTRSAMGVLFYRMGLNSSPFFGDYIEFAFGWRVEDRMRAGLRRERDELIALRDGTTNQAEKSRIQREIDAINRSLGTPVIRAEDFTANHDLSERSFHRISRLIMETPLEEVQIGEHEINYLLRSARRYRGLETPFDKGALLMAGERIIARLDNPVETELRRVFMQWQLRDSQGRHVLIGKLLEDFSRMSVNQFAETYGLSRDNAQQKTQIEWLEVIKRASNFLDTSSQFRRMFLDLDPRQTDAFLNAQRIAGNDRRVIEEWRNMEKVEEMIENAFRKHAEAEWNLLSEKMGTNLEPRFDELMEARDLRRFARDKLDIREENFQGDRLADYRTFLQRLAGIQQAWRNYHQIQAMHLSNIICR